MSSKRSMVFKPIQLYPHQLEAYEDLHNGCILCGDVGTGKTLTGLYYYLNKISHNRKLYVLTTAKKRDDGDWPAEAKLLGINEIVVDSWNNIKNYTQVKNAFFIFDEQRVVGSGTWAKSFIKIAKNNPWILLSGTPGDTWMDYIPVFVANGFYKNRTDFIEQHVEYDRFAKYPKVKRYHNTNKLLRLRRRVLIRMTMQRHTLRHRNYMETYYDEELYKEAVTRRWNVFDDKPMRTKSEFVQVVRRIVATSDGRIHEAGWQLTHQRKVIVFYNYDYELMILRDLCEFLGKPFAEYNGHKHEDIPKNREWAYLVQYTAGAEGWNCTETDHMLFYSPNYSWKVTEQSEGRIDRLNTPFTDLHYTYLTSKAQIDKDVIKANLTKRKFNESAWVKGGKFYE